MTKFISKHQRGFTLLELMIALVIGLLVMAAAMHLFLNGVVSAKMQESAAELQDSGILGLDYIAKDIRLANFGNDNQPVLNTATPAGGIVFTSGEDESNVNLSVDADEELLTKSGNPTGLDGANSDQLTIQFKAPGDMYNCVGRKISQGDYVIQRYFLRANGKGNALVCQANTSTGTSASVAGLNGSGEIIMPNVDQLRFYLGTKVGNGADAKMAYYSIDDYKTQSATANPPRIVSIKVIVLVRSNNTNSSEHIDPSEDTYKFLENVGLKASDTKSKYLRRLYATTIAIRNGLGEKVYE